MPEQGKGVLDAIELAVDVNVEGGLPGGGVECFERTGGSGDPALLTSTSRPPSSSATVAMSSRTWASSETS